MKKIEPGMVCRILPGAQHDTDNHRDCCAGMITVTRNIDSTIPYTGIWWKVESVVCSRGTLVTGVQEIFLEPMIDPNVVKEYDERHKNAPEPVVVGARLPWIPAKKPA